MSTRWRDATGSGGPRTKPPRFKGRPASRAPHANFPALPLPVTARDSRGLPPTQGKARPGRPGRRGSLRFFPLPLRPGREGAGCRRGGGRGARALPGAGARRPFLGGEGKAGGRSRRGRRGGDAGRREARRAPKASDAAGPAAGEDKAPRSPAPPPPASQPATQRHAHGRRRLGTSLAAPPPGSAHRTRPPRPFPARGGSARRARTWPPAPGARRHPLAPAARFPPCAGDPVSAREETETSCKSGSPGPGRVCGAASGDSPSRPPEPWISEVCTDPLRTRTEALGSGLRQGML
eukprot:XP_013970481.1 uncharacterized protein LOC106558992 [Canis lupus familiaris]